MTSFHKSLVLSLAGAAIIGAGIALLAIGFINYYDEVQCEFSHGLGEFTTTVWQAESRSPMITVWREDRIFMLPKSRILVCE